MKSLKVIIGFLHCILIANAYTSTCSDAVQENLLYNVNKYTAASVGLPNGSSDELLSEAICCDSAYRNYSEPNGFFAFPDIKLFAKLDSTGVTTFYDSVCGIPLFMAPLNRTFSEWKSDTNSHGWPSFRPPEILTDNVYISSDNLHVYSTCGTYLGGYDPDEKGDRSEEIFSPREPDRCTTIAVGKNAGITGPMNTHTADCSDCDFRVNKVPAKDWPKDSMRPLYLYKGNYPYLITKSRGKTWHPDNLEGSSDQLKLWGEESVITGYIRQVEHTYALIEAGYAIMNEFQVAIGESTCAAKFWAAPTFAGGKARIEASEMSKIALERTKTARDAIKLMGNLSVELGFYAADWSGGDISKGEGGEGLTVIDKEEAWIFHVLADDTGTSAVWVAQRVPDDHIAAIANQFVIRHIDPNSPDFLYSDNIWEVAKRNNLWSESDGLLDFLTVYAPIRAHSTYASRRVWRVFNLAAPSIPLNPFTDAMTNDYPFSIKVDKPLSPEDLMRMNRDHYEGTIFDLTKGLAAGPYGDPQRYDITPVENKTFADMVQGSFERAISLFRTSYSFVAVARKDVPDIFSLLWFGQYAPSSTSYTPFYVSAEELPEPYTRGSLFQYDPTVSYWNFCLIGNYASKFYKYAMTDVKELQDQLQIQANYAVNNVEAALIRLLSYDSTSERKLDENNNIDTNTEVNEGGSIRHIVIKTLTTLTIEQGHKTVDSWRNFFPKLVTKYHDGYRAENLDKASIRMKKLFYPLWWLDITGYWDSKPNEGPDVIMFHPDPNAGYHSHTTLIAAIIISFLSACIIGLIISKQSKSIPRYSSIVDTDDDINNNNNFTNRNKSFSLPKSFISLSNYQLNVFGKYNKPNKREYVSLDI